MTLLHLSALPLKTTKGTIVQLLVQVGGLDKKKIGRIEIAGRGATVEVPDANAARLVKELDGTSLAHQHIRAWTDGHASATDQHAHFQRLLDLLELEAAEEARQAALAARRSGEAAEATGTTLTKLMLRDADTGLGDRMLVTFGMREPGARLPWTRLDVGSPILLNSEPPRGEALRGVVSARGSHEIQLALGRLPDSYGEDASYRIDLSSDEIGRQRQRAALGRAASASGDRLAILRDVLLGARSPEFSDNAPTTLANYTPNAAAQRPANLNDSQLAAVELATGAEHLAIIHGPPGTGKTTTLVEIIRRAVNAGQRVLACAPSNLAVDNLMEKLLAAGLPAMRLGHPARVTPELRAHTLDLLVEAHPDIRLAKKFVKEAFALRDQASRFTRAKPVPGHKQALRTEASQLLADARRLEAQIVEELLDRARVLCATNTALDSELLGQRTFATVVIDEACQCTEPACWIPVQRAERIVLAGDHCQLPPTVISAAAQRGGFGVSLLERLMTGSGAPAARQLTVQYRMHAAIMEFSSREFYDETLVADTTVVAHVLAGLPGVTNDDSTQTPLEFIDTAGAGFDEAREVDGESRFNRREAELAARKVQALLDAGVAPRDIAVIAPYSAQVRLLRELLAETGVEIDSVDGFQGREKEAVVISLVRSNGECEIGFLADVRRMNVALTRARRKLIVIGDSATIAAHAFYARLMEHFELYGAYKSVWEEQTWD